MSSLNLSLFLFLLNSCAFLSLLPLQYYFSRQFNLQFSLELFHSFKLGAAFNLISV